MVPARPPSPTSPCAASRRSPRPSRGRGILTRQDEDVHQGLAVVQPRGHDAVGPQPLGAQLVQFAAGGDGVAAGDHPVVGGRGDNDADPAHEARHEAHDLQARGHHGGRPALRASPRTRCLRPGRGCTGRSWCPSPRPAAPAATATEGTSRAGRPTARGGDSARLGSGPRPPFLKARGAARERQWEPGPSRAGQSRPGIPRGWGHGRGGRGRAQQPADPRVACGSREPAAGEGRGRGGGGGGRPCWNPATL